MNKYSERNAERFKRKFKQINGKYLRKIEELPQMPENMKPFIDVLEKIYVNLENIPFTENRNAMRYDTI